MSENMPERIRSLLAVCRREMDYLHRTDRRLFAAPITVSRIRRLPEDDELAELAERVDAFVARFGRLQDTMGGKLFPAFLRLMEETPGAMIENLDRMERLGLLESADGWITIRKLRNRMIHEYASAPEELADALDAAHEYVPVFRITLDRVVERIGRRYPEITR
uniref:DUF86 domain-containing protein n=1 Tax=Candidatus Kentrum sp. FM TaxID=2126340 RepID=A0A450SSI9_9GAMM|nr:MAG: hypothetical protein BECKFM1743A_GA0114220_101775 [Candidatus Kentron sp. FM]VFJ58772.1 MAG: hypothetical protein BECKFM1743C_GA0114222_102335 [Candidatus Kentron sp. FM]VFK17949.1 MAG: hypothetical protein BECKFM1743B_GA0114221_105153 [Candidatus Kentron sp. FM]